MPAHAVHIRCCLGGVARQEYLPRLWAIGLAYQSGHLEDMPCWPQAPTDLREVFDVEAAVSGVPERKKAESVLLRWVGLADAAEVQPPASCEQWVVEHERLGKVFNNHRIYKPNCYMRNYTIRALIMSATSKRLSGAASIATARFARAFPDQGKWLRFLPRRGSNGSLEEFMQDLDYDGAPEMLSMFLCLLLTPRMWQAPEWYAKHGRALTKAMVEQLTKEGVYRLPLVCVEAFRVARRH